MKLTQEQMAVVNSSGDIKINAVAGSGKTTTLIEYAKTQNPSSKILYLAFNRSVRTEAKKKFADNKLTNVDIQTAHSLAYSRIVFQYGYKVSPGYKTWQIRDTLGLSADMIDPHSAALIAWHVSRCTALFCNSIAERVADVDYEASLTDQNARGFVCANKKHILHATRRFLAMMDKNQIPVTHEFYLKKFQLSKPVLNYDLILFDEGQDASPVMLHIFLSQKCQKVIVGDIHQQIYGWRHAVNAMGSVNFKEYTLSQSFRFDNKIAELAMECLRWKECLGSDMSAIAMQGVCKKTSGKIKSRAIIARTNLALFKKAIEMVAQKRTAPSNLYFEGNLNSYTYASEGTSLYDVLNLYLDQKERIRDPMVKEMADFDQIVDYAEKTDDKDLGMLIELVTEYGRELPFLIKQLKDAHVEDTMREKAAVIFSTVHRCKGMEYDSVQLLDDFVNRDTVKRLKEKQETDIGRLEEEINLVYVAVTRTKKRLEVPDDMFPHYQPDPVPIKKKTRRCAVSIQQNTGSNYAKTTGWNEQGDNYSGKYSNRKRRNANRSWTKEMDIELEKMIMRGMPPDDIAEELGRGIGAINCRIRKLGIEDFVN